MAIADMYLIRKALVTLTIEQALIEIGGVGLLNEVLRILYDKRGCYLPDCYDNPENFKEVWRELDKGTCNLMLNLAKEKLEEFTYQKSISNFLDELSQISCVQRR
jgi:hypothetical protein